MPIRFPYNLAPILSVFGVILTVAVIAFGPGWIGVDLNIGVLYSGGTRLDWDYGGANGRLEQ